MLANLRAVVGTDGQGTRDQDALTLAIVQRLSSETPRTTLNRFIDLKMIDTQAAEASFPRSTRTVDTLEIGLDTPEWLYVGCKHFWLD